MNLERVRARLPPEWAATIDLETAWARFRDEAGSIGSSDEFIAWLQRAQQPHSDGASISRERPVEVTRVLPARFAAGAIDTRNHPHSADTHARAAAVPGNAGFPYELIGNAGRGGMGTVHVARDIELARRVALKELNADVLEVDGIRERFIREAQITAQLDHPNVVPVYALEVTPQGTPAYTMKYVQGKTFQTLIEEIRDARERGEEPDEAHAQATCLEHFLKVADAMAYAHDKGVIHRDLKPANLMLGRHNEVYVMDWGLCRLLGQPDLQQSPDTSWLLGGANISGGASQTQAGDLIGTPRYMSPEQAGARNLEIDARSDQYALGLILYELVTLQTPYDGSSAYDVLMNARAGRRRAVKSIHRSVRIARELVAIIERATALVPAERYASVAAFAADIRRFVRGEAVHAAPDTPWQRMQRLIVRHRQKATIGILALIALSAIAIGALLWQNQRTIERAHQREQRMLSLRNAVADAGDRIQTRLLQLEGALSDLASSTEQALEFAAPSATPIYMIGDFLDPAHAPPDLMAAPEFGGKVSLRWPVWVLAPGVDAAAARVEIERMANLQEFYAALYRRIQSVVRGDSVSFYSTEPIAPTKNVDNVIVAGIALGLADGVSALYPGWDGIAPGFDPRTTDWYRIAQNEHAPRWGEPSRITPSSPPVIPLSIPLHDRAQHFVGVLSLTLVSQRFLSDLLDRGKAPGIESVLLTDTHGHLLATARGKDRSAAPDPRDQALADAALVRLKASGDDTAWLDLAGQRRLIIADNIDPLGWTLIAVARESLGEER